MTHLEYWLLHNHSVNDVVSSSEYSYSCKRPCVVKMQKRACCLNVHFCLQPPPGGKMIIQNFSDPHVIGAACAAVDQITAISNSKYKSVLVVIANGTYQVRTYVYEL